MDAGTAPRLSVPFAISGAMHVAVLAALIILRGEAPPAQPPIYRVNLVAAPPGPRAIGTVTPPTTRPVPPTATPPPRSQSNPRDMPPPVTKPPAQRAPPAAATPTPTPTKQANPTPAPPAGGGAQGGRGADVANVRIEGIVFPYTGYLENIVRQIALRFEPPNRNAPLRAVVSFLIHRDGRVSGLRLVTRSGVYAFDVESTGSIEAAAAANAFGPLPAGYSDDVLPVIFSFDPSLIR
jgi:outer membrane biosynthesis protein TonB